MIPAIHRILAPVDLTTGSPEILRYAVAWAQLLEADLHVVHVVADAIPPPTPDVEAAARAVAELAGSTPMDAERVHTAVLTGDAASAIERYAADERIDLIIMAAHRHNAFARLALGSVAQQVVRRAPCPVVTVPPEATTPRWLGNVHTLLMPTDLGETSSVACGYARDLATALGAILRVLHVVIPPWERQLTYLAPPRVYTQVEQLTGVRPDRRDPAGADARIQAAVRIGFPGSEVVAYADRVHADLIVMATHSRGAFAQMLLGGVTQQVLRKAHCPVLTLNPAVCARLRESAPAAGESLDLSA